MRERAHRTMSLYSGYRTPKFTFIAPSKHVCLHPHTCSTNWFSLFQLPQYQDDHYTDYASDGTKEVAVMQFKQLFINELQYMYV